LVKYYIINIKRPVNKQNTNDIQAGLCNLHTDSFNTFLRHLLNVASSTALTDSKNCKNCHIKFNIKSVQCQMDLERKAVILVL